MVKNLKVGDIVIINQPPAVWRMGRVIECHPGRNGVVRVVTMHTQEDTFTKLV